MSDLLKRAELIQPELVRIRREIHRNPELSGQETGTQQIIARELDKLGIPYSKAGHSSLIARLQGTKTAGEPGGRTVALRGDIDALPIEEAADVNFRSSRPGVMHACGHDAHAAMVLGAAMLLSELKEQLTGEVRFFFQEAEETFGGAQKIIEAGGMEGVGMVFGMHGMLPLNSGQINISPGYRLSGCDTIYVRFEGVSGHGSSPHLAKDTIHPACQFVIDLQGIVTKNVDPQEPIVLSAGKISGGTKANIIAKQTDVEISMRYFSSEVRKTVHEGIRRHAQALAEAWEITADVRIEESALSLHNDPDAAALAARAAAKVLGQENVVDIPRQMASEDMPYYFLQAPGAYAFLGYRNEAKGCIYPPHHEKYKFDEDVLKLGASVHAQFALDYLNGE